MFAVPDSVPLRAAASHSETLMPCEPMVPLREKRPNETSGANGRVKVEALMSTSIDEPLGESLATSDSGPRRKALRTIPLSS